jgi:subtilisin family serine protease
MVAPPNAYVIRGEFDNYDAVRRLQSDRPEIVLGIHADLEISAFPFDTGKVDAPIGDADDVATKIGVAALRKTGLTGEGARIAIVDTGVDGTRVPVAGGWSLGAEYVPGSAAPWHGTMVAFDARLIAPDAEILDFALLRSTSTTWSAFLSDAIAAYVALMNEIRRTPGPLIVNNSWALYDRSQDAPVGSPENYSANLGHPFNQVVANLVAAGCDVIFAAGNCGLDCPSSMCGASDRGPGMSIHGANSHPDVISVAAVDIHDNRLHFSSQGPGGIYNRKPDIAAFSQFQGSRVMDADSGTSAASPLVAGLIAALRQHPKLRTMTPPQIKGLIQQTARNVSGGGWNSDFGYGVADGQAIVELMASLT